MNDHRDPGTDPQASPQAAQDPEGALAALTVAEKASLTAGRDVWVVSGIDRIGLPTLKMTDGPNGARGATIVDGTRSVCVPCGSALAATFDPAILRSVGALLGRESRQRRARVLLAPTINLIRSPLYGRSFECYGEDPWLSGSLAAAFIAGVQSEGVATTAKHLIGNETEHQRFTINSVIDERTLREMYLLPFEFAVRHGATLGVMTSYNRLNGRYCSEDGELLNGILRDEWGFEGFVVSDWFAAGSTAGSLEAGLDVQMPGPDRFFGRPLADAVEAGTVDPAHLDDIVRRRIHLHVALDAWDDDAETPEDGIEHDADRAIAAEAAASAMVLLANDGTLPLSEDVASVALIGPNAVTAHIMGGGSASIAAHRRMTPEQALHERLGDRLTVEPGCVIDKIAPPLRADGGFDVEFFADTELSGPVVATSHVPTGRVIWIGEPAEGVGTDPFSARLSGTLTIREAGAHTFTLIQDHGSRVLIDGVVMLDGVTTRPPRGEGFFGLTSEEMTCTVELEAGQSIEVVIEFEAKGGTGIRGVAVGHRIPQPPDLFERAVAAAAAADVAVVVVGTSSEWESEGEDRASITLPGDQEALIAAVCDANQRTCVVVNTGSPVLMEWADRAAAVLQCWLGGQEMALALADVLLGVAEPGGRLPVTIPHAIEQTPAFGSFPGESNETRYGEGLLVGYRWYDTRGLSVRYPFGHGLSYTSFEWSMPTVTHSDPARGAVELAITNTGNRAGSDVVQLYVEPPVSGGGLFRARRELRVAAKVFLEPGETSMVTLDLVPRSFAHWDPANNDHLALHQKMAGAADSVPSGGGSNTGSPEPGWYVEAGDYQLHLARSITDIAHSVTFAVTEPLGPLSAADSLP